MTVSISMVKQVVKEAGQMAMLYYGKVNRSTKSDHSIETEADGALENFFRLALNALAPNYGYISEETEKSEPPKGGETRTWVVDALDGSRAFAARLPLWTPVVCVLDGSRPIMGAAYNPVTNEMFWADEQGPAYCNDEPLVPAYSADVKHNTIIFGPTNIHRNLEIEFGGRVYSLGAPVYQFCLVARGSAEAIAFGSKVKLWDLALPALLLERSGGVMVYASGRPVDLGVLMDRRQVPEPIFAGGAELVERLRQNVEFLGRD